MNKLFLLAGLLALVSTAQAAENAPMEQKSNELMAQEHREYAARMKKAAEKTSIAYLGVCFAAAVVRKVPVVGRLKPVTMAMSIAEWPLGFAGLGCSLVRLWAQEEAKRCEGQGAGMNS